MTAESELIKPKIRDRVTRSGVLDPGEEMTAYVNGFVLPLSTSALKLALRAIAAPYRPSSWRAVILTDRQLYICSLAGGRPGKLKSVLARFPRGSFTAAISEGDRLASLTVEDEDINCPKRGRMRRCADLIVEAGRPTVSR